MTPGLRSAALLVAFTPLGALAQDRAALDARFDSELRPLLEQRCLECHGDRAKKGGLDLRAWTSGAFARGELGALAEMQRRLEAGEMPPPERERPAREELERALAWIGAALRDGAAIDPGRVSLRRLTRLEYRNTVRDLFGLALDLEERLPADPVGAGFDTLGDLQLLSPLLLERYLELAEEIAARAVPSAATIDLLRPASAFVGGDELEVGGVEARGLYSHGEFELEVSLPRAGRYRLELRGSGDQAGPEAPRLELRAAQRALGAVSFASRRAELETQTLEVELPAGPVRLAAEFANDYYRPEEPDRGARDRNVYLASWHLRGPLDAPPRSAFQRSCVDRADGGGERAREEVVRDLLERAWRRPPERADVERVLSLAPADATADEALRRAIEAALVSPRFLFRPEGLAESAVAEDGGVGLALDGYELATRLSYFVWASAPDDALRAAAARGELATADGLRRELRRLLRDVRASALVEGFAAQWLQLGRLEEAAPDEERFPHFDRALRRSMRQETELFFEALLREDRPLEELVAAEFGFVDERLARHYGLEGVRGPQFRRVALPSGERGGILAHASILTLTSNPARTSPVKRGKWILEVLLDAPPPPPPPEAGALAEDPESALLPLRERLARHRRDPSCASCHVRMDALGFALEAYGPTGQRRARDEAGPIDPKGELPDGRAVVDLAGLRAVLLEGVSLERAALRALFVYALGRELTATDEPLLARALETLATRRAAGEERTLRTLIEVVATSEAFRRRSAEDRR
ncbi:MAG: DUF1592 domain-containing protein [Planctomycetes bacterium]|nr:DUF1592 domain-containing protein [Planctomycetota bacterium]